MWNFPFEEKHDKKVTKVEKISTEQLKDKLNAYNLFGNSSSVWNAYMVIYSNKRLIDP